MDPLQVAGTADELDSSAVRPLTGGVNDAVNQGNSNGNTTVDVSSSSSSPYSSLLIPNPNPNLFLNVRDSNGNNIEDSNQGSQSPARKIIDLPPAIDLAEGDGEEQQEEGHDEEGEREDDDDDHEAEEDQGGQAGAGPGGNGDGSIDVVGTGEGSASSFLEDVPLTPLDTARALAAAGESLPPSPAQEYAPRQLTAEDAVPSNQTGAGEGQQQHTDDNQPLPPPPPPPRQPKFAYHHDDTDSTEKELEEFFSYVEVRSIVEDGRLAWGRGWEDPSHNSPDWPTAPLARKKAHVAHLIEELEHSVPESRFDAARRIAYIAHGTPHYSTSSQHHLHLVVSNCNLLRECGVLAAVHDALKGAGGRWNVISSLPESEVPHYPGQYQQHQQYPSLTPQERQDYLEEVNGELAIHLSILYFMTETCRGDEGWADELMALDPPLPVYLINLVAALREKNAKGYPVKKLLLLLWKSLLACLGGDKDIRRVKKLVRNIEGLPEDKDSPQLTEAGAAPIHLKATPIDYTTFKSDILSKYPAYEPPVVLAPIPQVPLERVAIAGTSAPLRAAVSSIAASSSMNGMMGPDLLQNQQQQQQHPPGPMPTTPAPTPPPSPPIARPKKQQYQTDQTRPFVLPFSSTNLGGGHYSSIKGKGRMTVPFSIDEAGKLYKRNIRISTELWQSWKLREEYLADETGAGQDSDQPGSNAEQLSSLGRHFDTMSLENDTSSEAPHPSGRQKSEAPAEPKIDALGLLYQLERKVKEELKGLRYEAEDDNKAARTERRKLVQKIKDVKKLQRVELIYRLTLPNMQSAVIVLLKLLLATVTANTPANTNVAEGDQAPPQTLEETDIMRHREITSKAVSAIIILTLRWFKTSHAMKFHYLAHLLTDSNCLLLILKMFGLQEVSNQVRVRNEVEIWNFFQYCQSYGSSGPPPPRPEDSMLQVRAQPIPALNEDGTLRDPDEPDIITVFSWRNFFSVINFMHILQKLTKRKAHRILLLVQYKSSAILKRILKVSHPILQLYVLKVIKSQVAYCGRKWRQSNMKVITAIYLNCRPDLRDEWLTTIDVDTDLDESLPHEQSLRTLVRFFNAKHYAAFTPQLHHRTSSHLSNGGSGFQDQGQQHGSMPGSNGFPPMPSPSSAFYPNIHSGGFFDGEFPPSRSLTTFNGDDHFRTSYIPDSLMDGYLEDYEDMLGDFFTPVYDAQGMPIPSSHTMQSGMSCMGQSSPGLGPRNQGSISPGRVLGGDGYSMGATYLSSAEHAWHRLGEILGDADSISDSESVASIGILDVVEDSDGSDSLSDDGSQAGRSDWDHLSPDLVSALEEDEAERAREERKSPHRRRRSASPHSPRLRRSSSGTPRSPALRPVLVDVDNPDYDERGKAVFDDGDEDDDGDDEDEDEDEDGGHGAYPMARSPRRSPHLSPQRVAIDEVEAFFST